MEKKSFEFYQDVKVKVWQRQHFTIEAETIEEARELAKQYANEDISCVEEVEVENIEWLHDTIEPITPVENGASATIEVYEYVGKYGGNLLADNALKEVAYRELIGYQIVDCNGDYPDDFDDHDVFRTERDAQDWLDEEIGHPNIYHIKERFAEDEDDMKRYYHFYGKKPRIFKKGERVFVEPGHEGYPAIVVHNTSVIYEDELVEVHALLDAEDDDSSGIETRRVAATLIYQFADGKVCPRCGNPLYVEHHDEIDYPYYCTACQENFYNIEVQ